MLSLNINGKAYQVDVDPTTPLLWVLRDILGLTGTKYGCGIEVCWACTVMVNGQPEKSCHYEVKEAVGKTITTIEGLSADGLSHPFQKAWIANQVPQCGYCQSGVLMQAACRLKQNPSASASEIINEIQNVCVCGTYQRMQEAVKSVRG